MSPIPPHAAPAAIGPTAPSERIQTLDILRGLALLGILLVNMVMFNHTYYGYIGGVEPDNALDRAAALFIKFFAEGKFYSMFSFLFGVGMALFMQRAAAKGVPFVPVYARRLLALLGFGLIHAYLFWVGDILILYALLGFVTLFVFRNCRPRTLVRWSIVSLLLPILINAALWGLLALAAMTNPGIQEEVAASMPDYARMDAEAGLVYATGTFAEITRQRAIDMLTVYATWPFMAFNVMAMFLLGFAAGKARLHETLAQRKDFLRRVLVWGLVVGVIGNLCYVVAGAYSNRAEASGLNVLATTGQTIGAPALSMAYMAAICLFAMDARRARQLAPVAAAGRMAITNYLMQTVICTTLFYGYGFGLYGIGEALGIVLTVVIWLVQVAWSAWWLKRFRFGPVEWLWRTITYWKPQPMRLPRATPPPAAAHPA